MAIKRTKYCALKSCHKPITNGEYCCFEHAIQGAMIKGKKQSEKTGNPNVTVNVSYPAKIKRVFLKNVRFGYPIKKKKQNPIRPRSKKRAEEYKEYNRIRLIFLKDKICPITKRPATEIHHKKGKIGKLLTDERYFLGVTREGHEWIEANPEESYKLGYSIKRTSTTE